MTARAPKLGPPAWLLALAAALAAACSPTTGSIKPAGDIYAEAKKHQADCRHSARGSSERSETGSASPGPSPAAA